MSNRNLCFLVVLTGKHHRLAIVPGRPMRRADLHDRVGAIRARRELL
jgi:hypothetical protein